MGQLVLAAILMTGMTEHFLRRTNKLTNFSPKSNFCGQFDAIFLYLSL